MRRVRLQSAAETRGTIGETMTPVTTTHIWLDDRGVAWIDDTNVKVIEVAAEWRYTRMTPEEMVQQHYGKPNLAQVFAALSYYAEHQPEFDAEMDRLDREYTCNGGRRIWIRRYATSLGCVLFTHDPDLLAEADRRHRVGETFAGLVFVRRSAAQEAGKSVPGRPRSRRAPGLRRYANSPLEALNYIFPITALANSLHFTSFAPSMRRAKSYVTVLPPIAPSIPLMIRSAASVQPM